MDYLTRQLKRFKDELATIAHKLTISQRITVALLAVIVALALLLVMSLHSSSGSMVFFRSFSESQDLELMRSLLEGHEIEYEVVGSGDSVKLLVDRRKLAQARWLAIESGASEGRQDNLEWLFEDPSLIMSDTQMTGKLLESRKRDLIETLRWSPSIRNAEVVPHKGPVSPFLSRTNDNDTALVALLLAPGVKKLTSKESRSVRLAVQGAFNIPPRNIQITDQHGNNYAYVESVVDGGFDDENSVQLKILGQIERIYSRIFLPSQFVVGVLVDVSNKRSRVDTETFEPDAVSAATRQITTDDTATRGSDAPSSGIVPSVATGALGSVPPRISETTVVERETRKHTETEYDTRFNKEVKTVEVPAGEVQGVSVSVVIDQSAIKSMLEKEDETINGGNAPTDDRGQPIAMGTRIATYAAEQEKVLTGLIPMAGAKVSVSAVMFPTPAAPPEISVVSMTGSWMARHWTDVAMGLIALVGIGAAMAMLRRTTPATVQIPNLEDQILVEEDRRNASEMQALMKELDAVKRGHLDIFPREEDPERDERKGGDLAAVRDEVAESVELLNQLTKERPSMVASVLKGWIRSSSKDEL